jgi:Uma2 family endonuclease
VSALSKTFLTAEEYLEFERKVEYKSEYYLGEMFAMAGASYAHNLLVSNILFRLRQGLGPRPCSVLPSDMRVRVSPTGLYTYPDVVVVCGEPQFPDEQKDALLNPSLLVEVLSPSTEAYDLGRKFEHYRSIESLGEYLVVATDRIHADLFTRQADGGWLLRSANRMEDSLDLQSVGCRLTLADLYEKVELSESPRTRP